MNLRQIVFSLIMLLMGTSLPASATPLSLKTQKAIATLFADAGPKTPGFAFGIVKNGRLIYAQGFGDANLDDDVPITPHTVFHLASLSKQFTAAALAHDIQGGKVHLTDPVETYFPLPADLSGKLQIRHLVYMTSGLVDYTDVPRPNGDPWFSDYYFNIDDAVAASLSKPLEFQPGTQWAYRNINFMLIAKIVEHVDGRSLGDSLKAEFFQPLGMAHTLLDDDTTEIIPHRAIGYAERSPEILKELSSVGIKAQAQGQWVRLNRVSPHYGGSGVFSSLDDLALWIGNFETAKVGGPGFVQLMYRTETFANGKDNDAFGLVWRDYNGLRYVDYAGSDLDTNTYMAHFPNQHLGLICLSNRINSDCEGRTRQAMLILTKAGLLPQHR